MSEWPAIAFPPAQLRRCLAATLLGLAVTVLPSLADARSNYVSLEAYQTPIRNQGHRRTCISFSAIAALEAAYNRAGYGQLDLSEQFLNYSGKMMWLRNKWTEIVAKGEDGAEDQVGEWGGGSGAAYVEQLAKGMKVPQEAAMPYHARDFTVKDHPYLANDWLSPFWTQRHMSDINLDQRFLPQAALTQSRYYSVRRYARIAANNTDQIEQVLADGHEVVWDRADHSLLLIGYDRRDADPRNHHFIAKDSHGPTQEAGGFSRLSYDQIRTGGRTAAYIIEVERPSSWPELAYLGRWNLNFDGHKGVLDIYHIPGLAQWNLDRTDSRLVDRRIGSFYDEHDRAYRVNGRMSANQIEFYIDWSNPNARWDQIGGRRFVYGRPVEHTMTGFHVDPDGYEYAGFATQGPAFADDSRTRRPFTAHSFLGTWKAVFMLPRPTSGSPGSGALRLAAMDNDFLTAAERQKFNGITGEFIDAGRDRFEVQALVDKRQTNKLVIRLRRAAPTTDMRIYEGVGYHLNHTAGIVAGRGTAATADLEFILVREGSPAQ
jgi:hypothetical protein